MRLRPPPPRTGRRRAEASAEPARGNKKESGLNHKTQGLAGRWKRVRGRVVMEGSVASCCGAAGSDVVRSWRGEDPHWDRQPYNSGRRQCVWGRHGAFGVGYGSLGQVNNLPQCGLTCPNAANVPQCDPRRLGGRGARATGSVFTALPHFASVITLAKWRHPFENSASLAKQPTASTRRARLPFESTASLAKRPRPCPDRRTFQCATPPRRDGRPYSRGSALPPRRRREGRSRPDHRGSAPRSCSYPPGVTGWPPL